MTLPKCRRKPKSQSERGPSVTYGLISSDSCSGHAGLLKAQNHGHGVVAAITTAFDQHLLLSLRPEHFWVLVLQAVARHVNAHTDEPRAKFINHEGKETLNVYRDEWVGKLGASGPDWSGVVNEFSEQTDGKTIPGVAELLANDFSTTTPTERVAAQVTAMEMLQEFFDYTMMTSCGYPTTPPSRSRVPPRTGTDSGPRSKRSSARSAPRSLPTGGPPR
eukprot:m.47359 g.47359  ORF g.47359 m.47359 type:complete len:219 (-) comp15613_c0_seq1:835-1491(-)